MKAGFLDKDLEHFKKSFDDCYAHFETFEDASLIADTLDERQGVGITPLSYPKYLFPGLQGNIYATRQIDDKITCMVEPHMGLSFRIAVCDLKTKRVTKAQ